MTGAKDISKLYVDLSVTERLGQEDTRNMETGRGVSQGCCLSPILFNLYNEYLTKKAPEGFGDFKIGHVIYTVKYADDLVLLAKEETKVQSMTDGLGQDGRHYEMDINVENTKVMRISSDPSPVQIMTDQKQLGNVEFFYLGSLRTSDARCTHEIN